MGTHQRSAEVRRRPSTELGRNPPAVVTAASNSPTAPTHDSNRRRCRKPWTTTTPLSHTPKRIRPHRRSSPATRLALPGGVQSPPLLSLFVAVMSTRVYRGALGNREAPRGSYPRVNAAPTCPILARAERLGRRTGTTSSAFCSTGPTRQRAHNYLRDRAHEQWPSEHARQRGDLTRVAHTEVTGARERLASGPREAAGRARAQRLVLGRVEGKCPWARNEAVGP
jgi:hypothetical protein